MNDNSLDYDSSKRVLSRPALLCALGGMLLAATVPAPARAQTLEEVVVTATKRDTDLQKTAVAISAYSAADLASGRIQSIADISATTPSLFVGGDNSLGSLPVAIRGIGSLNLSVGADEGVGVYVDGVYQGKPIANQFTFIDVDSIEVLRGPQGTLYGRNATGGAIVIHTLTPGPQTVVKADVSLTNLDGYEAHGLASGELVENVLYGKIAAGHSQRDGYSHNPLTGEDLNDAHDSMVSGALRWTPGDNWDITLRGYAGRNEASFAYKNALDGLPIDQVPASEPNESRKVYSGGTLNISTSFGGAHFDSITGYTDAKAHYLSSSANVGLTQVAMDPIGSHEWYQEFRLASADDRAFTWIVGANYYREQAYARTNFALLFVPLGLNFHSHLATESEAGFLELGYRFTDRLKVTAGARYTRDKKDWAVCNAAGLYTNLANLQPDVCTGLYGFDHGSWGAVTPRVVLDYQVLPSVFTYASATKGFRGGGWNFTQPVTQPGSGVDPEDVWSYEAGLKAELLDHRVRGNLAVFWADYSNLQVRSPDPVTTLFGLRNAANATIKGFEAEVVATPVRALRIAATLSYLDATYSQYRFAVGGDITDNSGNQLNNAPKWQGSLDGEYEISLGDRGSLTPRIELRYISDVYFTEANRFPYGAQAHETVNAKLQYTSPTGTWAVRLFGDNLTNERKPTYAFEGITSDVIGVMIPPPRIYGAQVLYTFR